VEQFLEFVIKGLVDHPDEVVLIKLERDNKVVFNVQLHPEDIGKVIGKHGQTIEAIRAVLAVGAARAGMKAHLEVAE